MNRRIRSKEELPQSIPCNSYTRWKPYLGFVFQKDYNKCDVTEIADTKLASVLKTILNCAKSKMNGL